MLYYIQHTLQTPDGAKTKNILLGGVINVDNKPINFHAFTLATNANIRSALGSYFDFKIAKMNDYKNPVITIEPASIAVGANECTKLYTLLLQAYNKGGVLDKILEQNSKENFAKTIELAKVSIYNLYKGNVSMEDSEFLSECIFGFYKYTKYTTLNDFEILPNNLIDKDYFVETQNFINSFKKVTIIGNNITLKQNTYNDEFFINIPSYPALTNDDLADVSDLIPNLLEEVCRPYTENVAYTPNYRQVRNTPIKLIEGQKSNNGCLIFEYNERYYKSLLAQVKENIKAYYEDAGKSSQILDQNGNVKDSAVIDPYTQDYLLELCKQLYSLHWGHNKAVPILGAVKEDSSDNSDSYVTAESKYTFSQDATMGDNFINALVLLENYLKKVSVSCGYKVYVEAVLQLSRWGLDKPTALLFDNYDKVFILGTSVVKNKDANLEDCVVLPHNGCTSYVSGLIRLDKTMVDKGMSNIEAIAPYLSAEITIPVGVCVTTDYVAKDLAQQSDIPEDSIIKSVQYFSAIDFVRNVVKDTSFTKNIDGVSYDSGLIKLALEDITFTTITQVLDELHNNSTLTSYNPFFRSEDLVNIYMDINAKMDNEIPSSVLTILNSKFASPNLSTDFRTISFSTKEELLEKKQNYQIVGSIQNAIDVCVLKEVLPIFFKANKITSGAVDADFLNVYKQIMDEGFSTETAFYQIEHKCVYHENAVNLNDDKSVNKMNTFGTVKEEPQQTLEKQQDAEPVKNETVEEVKHSEVISVSNDISLYKPITLQNAENPRFIAINKDKLIGVVFTRKETNGSVTYTVMTSEEFNEMFPGKRLTSALPVKTITTIFLNQCMHLSEINRVKKKVFFHNKDAYLLFANTVIDLVKEGGK